MITPNYYRRYTKWWMTMCEPILELRQIPLSIPNKRVMTQKMLERNGLRLDPVDLYIGVFDRDDNLLGGGGLDGNVIKCVALDDSLRGLNVANTLITQLRSEAVLNGHMDIFVFTKPENERLFASLAFHTVGRSANALMMESNPRGIQSYVKKLSQLRVAANPQSSLPDGVIVMNCNPLTLGHRFLIQKAAGQCRHLYIIPVSEEKSLFSYADRKEMLMRATNDIPNVTVCPGSPYQISLATFPTYFLKEVSDGTDVSILLDLDIFTRHIAPAIGVSIRYAGSEPSDPLTARYNEMMAEILPEHNILFHQIDRLEKNNLPVSASSVRELIKNGQADKALQLIPPSSFRFLLSHIATEALRRELNLTPKPGLVDQNDCGAHKDMDYNLMQRSINTLGEAFKDILDISIDNPAPRRYKGLIWEQKLMQSTEGVNTHRGALFAISVTLHAAITLLNKNIPLSLQNLSAQTAKIASLMPGASNSNGMQTVNRFGVPGALMNAQSGYRQLYESWLPFYRTVKNRPEGDLLTLLKIMSEIDDTNVLHRGGSQGADFVKNRSAQLLADFSIDALKTFNRECIDRNLSPGGAADMLALLFIIDNITNK
ncbi:MAG: [citrate (pro-3S)-lyase] ligase [Prevotella sp.]|nr:[citrate (pro-3S)-lyase] ligase [Bacteroides sp.]MCM1366810.1 [citrate (pro-3S)-lyase] ligase [Prevotella sp.]MCM1437576.1 [citrate (pro-3S)-lyase] ligase [Prevotella sp.]